MIYLITLTSLLFSVFALVYYKNIYNYLFLFNIYIFLSSLINCFTPYGTKGITLESGLIIMVGITVMFITSIFFSYSRKKIKYKNGIVKSDSTCKKTVINNKLFFIFYTIALFYLIIKAIMVVKLLSSGVTMDYIRMSYNYIELGTTTPVEVMLRMYYIEPLSTLSYCMLPVFIYKYKNKFLLIKLMLLSMIILNLLVYGGRTIMINLIFVIILYAIIVKKHDNIKVSYIIKKYQKLIVVCTVCVLFVTVMRMQDAIDYIKEIYFNFFAWMPTFDAYLNNNGIIYSFGLVLVMGIIRFPITVLATVFNFDYPLIYKIASNIGVSLQNNIYISSDIKLNAHGSLFYYLYNDTGYLSLVIGFVALTYIYHYNYSRMEKYFNDYHIIKYLLIVISIASLKIRYQFYLPQYCFAFFYLRILLKVGGHYDRRQK